MQRMILSEEFMHARRAGELESWRAGNMRWVSYLDHKKKKPLPCVTKFHLHWCAGIKIIISWTNNLSILNLKNGFNVKIRALQEYVKDLLLPPLLTAQQDDRGVSHAPHTSLQKSQQLIENFCKQEWCRTLRRVGIYERVSVKIIFHWDPAPASLRPVKLFASFRVDKLQDRLTRYLCRIQSSTRIRKFQSGPTIFDWAANFLSLNRKIFHQKPFSSNEISVWRRR